MTILGSQGKPIHSKRKVLLRIEIVDVEAGTGIAEGSRMAFELDTNSRADVLTLLSKINAGIMQRLSAIGFFKPQSAQDEDAKQGPTLLDATGKKPN